MKKYILLILIIVISVALFSHGDKKDKGNAEENRVIFDENDIFTEIIIEMTNWDFSIDNIELNKGSKYRIRFVTFEGHHGIYIPDLKFKTPDLKVNESSIIDINIETAGEYKFFCYTPCGKGHKDMVGKIIVK